jgi:hypothetical protein
MFLENVVGVNSSRVKFHLAGGGRAWNSWSSHGLRTSGGPQVELSAGRVDSMQVGGGKIQDVAVVIGPFLAILSEAAGVALDGIVGYNFLRHYKVTIDYPNLVLSSFSP